MNLMGMRFKDFTWENNPTVLKMEQSRSVKETPLPFGENRTEVLGTTGRRISGEGYFTGPDCMGQWNALAAVFARGGPGGLQLPGQEPINAVMSSLKILSMEGENLVQYAFSFTELPPERRYSGFGRYRAALGESLWDYALRFQKEIGTLAEANPHIRDIALLEEGEEVVVP